MVSIADYFGGDCDFETPDDRSVTIILLLRLQSGFDGSNPDIFLQFQRVWRFEVSDRDSRKVPRSFPKVSLL